MKVMGIKKIARPMNQAKNEFVKWLKNNNADDIDVFEGNPAPEWDYYKSVVAFVGDCLYVVDFMVWRGREKIDLQDNENEYRKISISDFKELLE